jgi:uncharacterized protein (TIGR03083 family)
MTMTMPTMPRVPTLPRGEAMRLAAAEYQRFLDLLCSLPPQDWTRPTDCPGWDVRAIAAHALGMVELAASTRENRRQVTLARAHGAVFIDALTQLQVNERVEMTPAQIVDRYAARAPKAARHRRRTPSIARRATLPVTELVGDQVATWTVGYLVDVILTRDPWMHRIDIVRATGAAHVLTAEHDGRIVADVVAEWAARHGRPYRLRLSGPAGGDWMHGHGDGPFIEMDAIDFCRAVSGRGPAEGLLTTQVPF